MQQKQNTNEGVIPTLIAVESTAGAEVDCADRLNQLPKEIRQQQNHAGCWWHSCLGKQKGREMNPFPDVSIDVEIKN